MKVQKITVSKESALKIIKHFGVHCGVPEADGDVLLYRGDRGHSSIWMENREGGLHVSFLGCSLDDFKDQPKVLGKELNALLSDQRSCETCFEAQMSFAG